MGTGGGSALWAFLCWFGVELVVVCVCMLYCSEVRRFVAWQLKTPALAQGWDFRSAFGHLLGDCRFLLFLAVQRCPVVFADRRWMAV